MIPRDWEAVWSVFQDQGAKRKIIDPSVPIACFSKIYCIICCICEAARLYLEWLNILVFLGLRGSWEPFGAKNRKDQEILKWVGLVTFGYILPHALESTEKPRGEGQKSTVVTWGKTLVCWRTVPFSGGWNESE